MKSAHIGLITTLLLGIFILIGAGISLLIKKKDKIEDFSIGLAFGVIVTLLITDLLPEIIEIFGFKKCYLFIVFALIGFLLLKALDHFVPDHHNEKMTKKEEHENLVHIGIITTLTIMLHNIIEGMAVYSTALGNTELAFKLAIGVGFHNLPLGMVIANSLFTGKKIKSKSVFSIIGVSVSTFIGGLIMYLFKLTDLSNTVEGILLSLTTGMLLFIVIDELIPRITHIKKKKISIIGITSGVVMSIISLIIG